MPTDKMQSLRRIENSIDICQNLEMNIYIIECIFLNSGLFEGFVLFGINWMNVTLFQEFFVYFPQTIKLHSLS